MENIATTVPIHTDRNFDRKTSLPLQFSLNNDAAILQNSPATANGRFNWKELATFRTALKLGQNISAILILLFVLSKSRYYGAALGTQLEVSYIFLAINSLIGTVLLMGDALIKTHPLRRAFSSVLWFRVELWFNGLTAAAYYILGYCMLVDGFRYYEIGNNRLAAIFGFIAALLHLVDWWMSFSKRRDTIRRLENEKGGAAQENVV
ncbi:uncharacterized protein LOC134205758 [Armigeres subalbatus]|uniref:uncharacterized protein LOC134205758 n=1 Tax=Armigeres subalbatus TaxID=124917 RepID=UPI002ED38150